MKATIKTRKWVSMVILLSIVSLGLSSFTLKDPASVNSEEASNVKIEVRNYSDWDIRVKRKSDNGYTDKNIIRAHDKGSKSFTGANALVVQWKDGLKWRKYAEYKVTGSTMCVEATGKVLDLRGIKILTCK